MRRNCAVILCLLAFASHVYAQGLLGTILGTVSDGSGAAAGEVAVTVKNQATNLSIKTTTQANGLYQVPNLPIGTYSVSFAKPGFQNEVHTQILVQAERATTVNATLQVGAVTTTVEVTATPLRRLRAK